MKKEFTNPGKIHNSTFCGMVVLMSIICLPFFTFGQLITEKTKFSFEANETQEYKLTSFNAKSVEGKIYILWKVLEPTSKCVYKLERSYNNIDFDIIYSIAGNKSPNNMELINSYVDADPQNGMVYYRVKRYTQDDVLASASIDVDGLTNTNGSHLNLGARKQLIANIKE